MQAIASPTFRRVLGLGILLAAWGAGLVAQDVSPAQSSELKINPKSTIRGTSFQVTIPNAPPNPKLVKIALDGHALKADLVSTNTYSVSVPNVVDPKSPDFVPVGEHRVTVQMDQQWFNSDQMVTIERQEQAKPELTGISPTAVVNGSSSSRWVLSGRHFVTSPAEDNQVALDGVVLPI